MTEKNKKFYVIIERRYVSEFNYEAESAKEIEDMINWTTDELGPTKEMCNDFWDQLGEQELEQMNVDLMEYKITEIGKTDEHGNDYVTEYPWKKIDMNNKNNK